jgi:UDPglucose 6-dehydrogenase
MEISVIGTGYVGLVTGTCFAEMGNEVVCIDIDANRIEKLSQGIVPFYEPGLEELVQRNLKNKRLKFTTSAASAIQHSRIIFIAVGTPTGEDGASDLKYVSSAAEAIARAMNEPKTIVIKSTVPIGTFHQIEKIIREKTKYDFSIVSNPEFLKEGSAVSDFLKPERVVIGAQNEDAIELMKELYDPFIRSGNPILVMDNASAEFSKYACNAYLAMRISFINEIANLAEAIPSDINRSEKS